MSFFRNFTYLQVLWVCFTIICFPGEPVCSQKEVIKQNQQEYFHIKTFTPINGYNFKWYSSTGVMNIETPNKLLRLFSGKDTFYAGFKQISFTQPLIQVEKEPYISANFLKTILGITINNIQESEIKPIQELSTVSDSFTEQAAVPANLTSENRSLLNSVLMKEDLFTDTDGSDLQGEDIFSGMNLDDNKSEEKKENIKVDCDGLVDIISVKDGNSLVFEFIFNTKVPEYTFSKLSQESSIALSLHNCLLKIDEQKRLGTGNYLISRYYADLSDRDVNVIFTTTESVKKRVESTETTLVITFEPLVEKEVGTLETEQYLDDSNQKQSVVKTLFDSANINASSDLDLVTVCIDPGHGGRDSGIVFKENDKIIREKDINLQIALYLSAYLKKAGARVIMTRSEDVLCSNTKRIKEFANENINFSISIHAGFSAFEDSRGSVVFFKGTKSMTLAERIQKNLYSLLQGDFNEPRTCRAFIFKDITSAGCLLELGFLSNRFDREYLINPQGQKSIAKAIYKALTETR